MDTVESAAVGMGAVESAAVGTVATGNAPADDALLAVTAEAWLQVGLACGTGSREHAEGSVVLAYRLAGLPAPRHVVWLDSPRAAALVIAALRRGDPGGPLDGADLGPSVRAAVRSRPWARTRSAQLATRGPVGFARHWAASAARPWLQLVDQIVTPLRRGLEAEFPSGDPARDALLDAVYGQHDAAWLGAFDDAPELAGLAGVARNAGWWWPYANVAILTARPVAVHRDNFGRLHHGDGPALSYPDGFGLYAWRGMPIPAAVVAELATLTVERIRAETNAEIRRVMLEHFGYDRYLRESHATEVHRDGCGILWRIAFPNDEPLVMVEVVNSTPEPDGTSRTYVLRVPPDITTAQAGVAWTFDVDPADYSPLVQT